jgi:anti-sigma regulatory factor (Ser/Thr protein kinase)
MTEEMPTHMRLQPTPSAAAIARRRVAEVCRGRISEEAAETARLLVSELVTNCVLHAHTMITVAVDCSSESVAVAVGDDASEMPVVNHNVDDANAYGGRGMWLVNALAGEWGIDRRDDGGKVVWFRLP